MTRGAALLLCCLGSAGCSFAFVRPAPPALEQRRAIACTSSRFAPVADVVAAVELAGAALMVDLLRHMGHGGGSDDVSGEVRAMQAAALGLAGLTAASAAYGFDATAECARAKALLHMRLARPPPRPGCTGDAQCKNERRCVAGACVWPEPRAGP